jgi:acyl-CoA reductase-like NAD-dependent aldehyde dehydrogenase
MEGSVTAREYGCRIAGEPRRAASRHSDRREVLELVEPASGQSLGSVHLATEADIDDAVSAARRSLDGEWGKTSPSERSRLLHGFADAVQANRAELAELEARNIGKALSSVAAEFAGAVEMLRFYASAVGSISGSARALGRSLQHYTRKEPVGVCAQIVPWNYPALMAVWKLAPALAAGCSVVLKPDAQAPISAIRLAELAEEVGVPAGVINVVPADGPVVGAYLVAHPGVDKVAFTGSTATGSEVMRLAAHPLKRLTLELGGKSPNLIFADADRESALPSSVWSIFYAAGQSCEARSRLLVERSCYDEVVSSLVDLAGRVQVGDPLSRDTHMGSLVSKGHRDKVHALVEEGVSQGATVLLGGEPGDHAFYSPTVLADVDHRTIVSQEEIFGPVITAIPFEDEEEAIRIANEVRYGLFASVWTGDPARGPRIAARLKSGTVGINMPYTAFPGVPFGGYKQSGFGRELSVDALESYLETKSVIMGTGSAPLNPFRL